MPSAIAQAKAKDFQAFVITLPTPSGCRLFAGILALLPAPVDARCKLKEEMHAASSRRD
jgi:hypothetical protein